MQGAYGAQNSSLQKVLENLSAGATQQAAIINKICRRSSVVEHVIGNDGVGGPIPLGGTTLKN